MIMSKLWCIIVLLLCIPIAIAISDIQHSINENQITITFQGTPPFFINIRKDNLIGDPGGYIWASTNQNSFTYDLGFAVNPSGNFYYRIRDTEWSGVSTFHMGHPSCTDSDYGLDYDVKGTGEGIYAGISPTFGRTSYYTIDATCTTGCMKTSGEQFDTYSDYCVDDQILETYCDNNDLLQAQGYTCPNGCQDGACIASICGDSTCNQDETCMHCPEDCGPCSEGNVFYVDPVNGDMGNDGSYDSPWSTLQEVFENELIETQRYETLPYELDAPKITKNVGAPIKSGDTILLRSGYHGEVDYTGAYNTDYIKIAAQEGHTPYLKGIRFVAASRWVMRGLTITPEAAPTYEKGVLIDIEYHDWQGPSYDIIIEDNDLYSMQDISNWDIDDWANYAPDRGISNMASQTIIRNNRINAVIHGIVLSGDNALVENNIIDNIAGDGMVGGANDLTIQYNTIKNFYEVNDLHRDCIQFHRGQDETTPIKNAIVRGNLLISHETERYNPYVYAVQGITSFVHTPGFIQNFLVENNVVLNRHGHSIYFNNAENSRLINNIAYDPSGEYPRNWIRFGEESKNSIIRNNIAGMLYFEGENIEMDHNIDINDYSPETLFVDPQNYNMRPRAESPAIDAGSPVGAPAIDIEGTSRPQGSGYDIGAYEHN